LFSENQLFTYRVNKGSVTKRSERVNEQKEKIGRERDSHDNERRKSTTFTCLFECAKASLPWR